MARSHQCGRVTGFAYLEVLVAALVLAVCAVPAANAIKNGLDAGSASQAKATELRCLRNRMETVLAEPFASLNSAAGTSPSNYSLPPDANCLGRQVTITRTQFDGQNITPLPASASASQQDLALLLVQVTLVDDANKQVSDYTFSTVVAR